MNMNPDQQNYWDAIQKTPASNATGEEIPAYGLVELQGWDGNGFKAFKPRTDNCYVFVNGPVPIPATKTGSVNPVGQVASRARVFIATDGTAASGDTWGAQAGSFLAKSGNTGFLILDNDAAVSGMAWAEPVAAGGSGPADTNLFVKVTTLDTLTGVGTQDYLCAATPTNYDPTTLAWVDSGTLCYVRGTGRIGSSTSGLNSFSIGQRYAAKKIGQVEYSSGNFADLYEANSDACEDTSGTVYAGYIGGTNFQYIGGSQCFRGLSVWQTRTAFNDADGTHASYAQIISSDQYNSLVKMDGSAGADYSTQILISTSYYSTTPVAFMQIGPGDGISGVGATLIGVGVNGYNACALISNGGGVGSGSDTGVVAYTSGTYLYALLLEGTNGYLKKISGNPVLFASGMDSPTYSTNAGVDAGGTADIQVITGIGPPLVTATLHFKNGLYINTTTP
jgi:hypothetical protein